MKKINNIVISDDKFETLGNYLDGTDFNGVGYDKNVTLLEYGFVYDSRTGDLIVTHPSYVWNEMNVPIRFGVTKVSKEQIEEMFEKDSTQILSENKLTLPTWNEICEEYKINLIETTTSGLGLSKIHLTMTYEDLIEYLKTKM